MARRFLAAAMAGAVAFGSTMALAACELDCSHEAVASAERGAAKEDPPAAAGTESHSCHREEASNGGDVSVKGLQECTHSGPAEPPASLKREAAPFGSAVLALTARAAFDSTLVFSRQPLSQPRDPERGSSTQLSLRI